MIYFDMLPKEQRQIYHELSFTKEYGFVLFGGTAIALQLGHRVSVDFDFFRKEELISNDKKKIENFFAPVTILQDEKNTFVFLTQNGVQLSFFGSISFVQKENAIVLDNVLLAAKMTDLLATKLKATFDRAEYKDYRDIAEILKNGGTTLQEGFQKMKDFFGAGSFSQMQVLKNLTFFDDGNVSKLSEDDQQFLIKEVKRFLKSIKSAGQR
ncbi:MAG: hypothetical protein CSA19_00290 [Deltaproteobacteria bacterium]|nr:MAG: hypothetical protein CSA19_00290 [Deltaproteobacteria bacterium]